MFNRVIALIDMDCFYCQVEARLNPSLKGKPMAVVQYNTWKGGGIIAVNYEARDSGVTRFIRGEDAKKQCPEIELVAVPEVRGKADLTRYREASREVIAVLNEFSSSVEKASVDEAFLDLTDVLDCHSDKVTVDELQNTFVVGYPDEEGAGPWMKDVYDDGMNDVSLLKLVQGAALVEKIRAKVFEKTGFHCSAGISHNKILAKLSCGLHKPNKQTVLPHSSISVLYEKLPVQKIRNLGGKFGDAVKEQLNCETMGEVARFDLKELQQKFGEKSGTWLYNISRGIDLEPVKSRIVSKSIGCCKNFPGQLALKTKKDIKNWLLELASEVNERIQDDLITNKRKGTLVTVNTNYQESDKTVVFSRSTTLNNYDTEEIVRKLMILLSKINTTSKKSDSWNPPLTHLGMSVSKFVDLDTGGTLLNFFKPKANITDTPTESTPRTPSPVLSTSEEPSPKPSTSKQFPNEHIADYKSSFFCRYFKDRPLFVSVPSNEPEDETESSSFSVQAEVHQELPATRSLPKTKTSNVPKSENKSMEIDVDNIEVFEETTDTNANDKTETTNEEMLECCAECGKYVPLIDFLEHLDHHAALRLQREINREEIASNLSNIGSAPKGGAEKRKYKKSKTKESPVKKYQPITAFFSVKPPS